MIHELIMRYSPVPQVGHFPFMAERPFFIFTGLGSFISLFALHFTQYASMEPPSVLCCAASHSWHCCVATALVQQAATA